MTSQVRAASTGRRSAFDWLNIAQPRLPAPDGTDPDALLALMRTVRQEGVEGGELDGYLARDWRRFIYTLDLCLGVEGQCLELGAGPYFTTVLLREYTSLSLTLTNFFGGPETRGEDRIRYAAAGQADGEAHVLAYDHFNVETDRFPYADASFDIILFCEVLEHLTHDPLPALREMARVLKPGGRLVLTTPNVASARNLLRLMRGDNVHDRYSGYGPYGRHNREYTLDEVVRLLAHCGFWVERGFTANVKGSGMGSMIAGFLTQIGFGLWSRRRGRRLGQYIFVSATRGAEPSPGHPGWLYRSFDDQA
ncbi:SAM-dependent methyltransferase [Sphingobium sp. OAS761]|uniref:class I SAM-dependent methyltransferase n=1 Tax=Sphingobium sp. OAS761 TaxID=2817901 RepID=UPI00209F0665|nr:class I SAM-dependent methyltransferase [Sphingobium sp. OAS761]MCP1469419.1 SAM-dependent methyltransferase [Sphingobium sp. OAS761]